MRIIFMLISIVVGNFVGALIGSFIGVGGAVVGGIIVGVAIYYIYSLLSAQKTFIAGAVLFGVLNYISILVTGYIGSFTNLATGVLAIVFQAVVLSLLWGWVGGKAQPEKTVKTGLTV